MFHSDVFNECAYYFQDKATKLQLELTDLQNMEEPQSEDLNPLVCVKHISTAYNQPQWTCIVFIPGDTHGKENMEY